MNVKIPVVFLLFFLGSTAPLIWAQADGVIKGTVIDEKDKPVAKARVHIAENGPQSGHRLLQVYETNVDGRFTINHVPWGTYVILAGKEDDGYPDTKFAFYSNLEVPTVALGPLFPTADVTVRFAPKAGILDITSVVDAVTGKSLREASAVTLKRIDNPNFSITASASASHLFLPALTRVTIEINAQGYKPWPDQRREIRLQPEAELKLDVKLQPESPYPTVIDVLRDIGINNNRIFTLEEVQSSGDLLGQMRTYRLPHPSAKADFVKALDYLSRNVPNFSYEIDKKNARIVHIMDRRLAQQQEYALDKIVNDIDFTASASSLMSAISAKVNLILWMQLAASDDLLAIDLNEKVDLKASGLKVRDALSEILPLPKQGGLLWIAETELGPATVSIVKLCCTPQKH